MFVVILLLQTQQFYINKINRTKIFVKLLYIGKYSARIKRDLMKILKDYRPYTKLRLISYPSIEIGHLFKKSLGQIPFRYTSNVVYKFSCACGHSYIGQTCRRVSD